MLNKIKEFFLGKPKAAEPAPEAPYKIEAPQVEAKPSTQVKCGCGRSPSGFCVGLHALTTEEWAVHADNPAKKAPARAKKAPAVKPAVAAKKPRAKKTPAK
jgi:hypothetical protein